MTRPRRLDSSRPQAAEAGFVAICWTNTIGNLPPWGALECKLGNNPMVMAIPHSEGHVVLDFAQSQFSFGTLASYRKRGVPLPIVGGYDSAGSPTTDARSIEESQRPLPIGSWKGADLALMLDLRAAMLSGGDSTLRVSGRPTERDVAQVFIAVRPFGGGARGGGGRRRVEAYRGTDRTRQSFEVNDRHKADGGTSWK